MPAHCSRIRIVGSHLFVCRLDRAVARIALFGLYDLLDAPPVAELVLETTPILLIFEGAWSFTTGFLNCRANFFGHLLGKFITPVGQWQRDALFTVASKDESVAALIWMNAPSRDLRIEELRLQNDRKILLNFCFRNAEPSEVGLVGRELEELIPIANGDITRPFCILVNCRTLALPEIPVCDHSVVV
jgi:hypothetical protein